MKSIVGEIGAWYDGEAFERLGMAVNNEKMRSAVQDALAGVRLYESRALAGQVYELIRRLVVELVLAPNQALSEKEVAACLGISKTPVREAFIRLAEDRIVTIVPHSGTYAAAVNLDLAREGYIILTALEASCAARAAELISLAEVTRLRQLVDNLRRHAKADDTASYQEELPQFHDAIFSLAGFPDARKLIDATRFEIDRIKHIYGEKGWQPMPLSLAQLSNIVNALAKHDPEAARTGIIEHFRFIEQLIDGLDENGEWHETLVVLNRRRHDTRRRRK